MSEPISAERLDEIKKDVKHGLGVGYYDKRVSELLTEVERQAAVIAGIGDALVALKVELEEVK